MQKNKIIAILSLLSILLHFVLDSMIPFYGIYLLGGSVLVWDLLLKAWRREFGSDLLAGLSILTSLFLGEYLAGTIVILMLSGGALLESYASDNARSILRALAQRMPSLAHKKSGSEIIDIPLTQIQVGDELVIYPHDTCPVDGVVIEGSGQMDEAYLTGEPFEVEKTLGSMVLSGAINGQAVLSVRATKLPQDSRYAKIMQVMKDSEESRPRLRRLGDQLGAWYTPLALLVAVAAWIWSGDPTRFLSVLVVATPCPLLIAIPIAILGSISLAAKRAIIIKSPVALEQVNFCRTAIFDKTGTLTYGEPTLVDTVCAPSFSSSQVLQWVASLERYSKHPLAQAILKASREQNLSLLDVSEVHEPPGQGLTGFVGAAKIQVTSRNKLARQLPEEAALLPPTQGGLECVIVVNDHYAGVMRFHDAPRAESRSFVSHLQPQHHFDKVMIVSGDREIEVAYLAKQVGIEEVYAQKSPEEKLQIVRAETAKAKTLYVGDGINDAPAMMASTVGIAIGQNSEITSEAASVVILDNNLQKVDEFIHISQRLRRIALQSAVGGMALSFVGMIAASMGLLGPVQGALAQELIDVLAILNALRVAVVPKELSDFRS